MKIPKVAIIGHILQDPTEIEIPSNSRELRTLLQLSRFTRVLTKEGKLADHLAYLKRMKGLDKDERFTVWEMYLCSTLLLASHLRRNGFEVQLVNYIDSDNKEEVFGSLRAFAPDIVALSTTFVLSRIHLASIGQLLRTELPQAFIVAGGHHVFASLLYMTPKEQGSYLLQTSLDAFVNDSQGEGTLLELCRCFPNHLSSVANLVWRAKDGAVVNNSRLPEANDINDTLIDFNGIPEGSIVHIRTARSCNFKCAFCSYPTIAGDLSLMELDNVMAMLRECKDNGVKVVVFVDDTFNVPPPRFAALVDRMISEGVDLPWYSFLRCQFLDKECVRKMRHSGCAGVFLGVESGSDMILKNMSKGAVSESYRKGVKWLQDEGIITVGSFITGFPGETTKTVQETYEFIETAGLSYYFIQPFYYLHHTPIHRKAQKYGLKGSGLFWSHDTMDSREAVEHVNRLFLEIKNSTWVNPDYTLWEIAYLLGKGMGLDDINRYRTMINKMTADQMTGYGLVGGPPSGNR